MQHTKEVSRRADIEHLAALISASLTLFIMANAVEGYFDTVLGYFERKLPLEGAYLATLLSYALGTGIAYKFFKIVLTAILLGAAFTTMRSGSPLSVLGL